MHQARDGVLQPDEGSSETSIFPSASSFRLLLQPDEGSSETVTTTWCISSRSGNFNPTRVRLKLALPYCVTLKLSNFNPTRVRLKRSLTFAVDSPFRLLQPDEGSSETGP